MVTCEPAVFTVLQHARQGDVTDPKPIMEALDKLSDSVPVATPPPELARFLRLENTGKTEQFPLPISLPTCFLLSQLRWSFPWELPQQQPRWQLLQKSIPLQNKELYPTGVLSGSKNVGLALRYGDLEKYNLIYRKVFKRILRLHFGICCICCVLASYLGQIPGTAEVLEYFYFRFRQNWHFIP